ncbi:MAG TPA: flippase activity-associated protein Agl23, partial [Anaerolineaceae bacterium]|nr:flippase activity-associated protein Agl23 [Anaerolineaceae bacterium]
MQIEKERTSWLERPLASYLPAFNLETLLITLIIILAIFSRFYILGERVMSHDETNHVVPSFSLYQGQGYQHDPITHGPFQFHIVALSYFLLGDGDFSSRVPAALFSVATVLLGWLLFRRLFGRTGGLVAAFLLLISPYLSFYGRYTRNEAFIALYLLVMLFAILRYLETGRSRYLYLFTLAVVMHVCSKETSFIYSAQALFFLAVLLLVRVLNRPWVKPEKVRPFLLILLAAIILVGVGLGLGMLTGKGQTGNETPAANQPPQANSPTAVTPGEQPVLPPSKLPQGVVGLGVVLGVASVYFLATGYGLNNLRKERSFDLLILLGTLVLPSLSAFPLKLLGVKIPVNATEVNNLTTVTMVEIGAVVLALFLLSAAIGLWWKRKAWLGNAALYYAIFTVFYTTMFTNGAGFLTGIVGSLGYWLTQQGVQRGSQPWYFFALVQVPMYEYLPLLGTLLALGLAIAKRGFGGPFVEEPAVKEEEAETADEPAGETILPPERVAETEEMPDGDPATHVHTDEYFVQEKLPMMALLLYWAFSSLAAYSIAGEKMPWLTVHIATPMILCAAWAFGWLIDTTDWQRLWAQRGWLV